MTSSLLDRIYDGFSERQATRLFESLRSAPREAMKPRVTKDVMLSFVIAGLVHLITIGLFIAGVWLIVVTWFTWFSALLGVLLIATAWGLAPSTGEAPEHLLSREEAPELHKLVDSVATAMDTPPIDEIAVTEDVNASFSRYGVRRRSVLTIGVPLWLALNADQRVALVGHEMGHQANGDIARGFWVGSAFDTVLEWHGFLRPGYDSDATIVEMVTHFLMYVLSLPVYLIAWLLMHLLWTQSQRAEYLADHLGARVSGSGAFQSLNDRMMQLEACDTALFDATLATPSRDPQYGTIFKRYIKSVEGVTSEAVAQHIAAHGGDKHAIDSTHPPTLFRNQMVEAFPCEPVVMLTEDASAKTEEEVSIHNEVLGRSLVRRWSNYFN